MAETHRQPFEATCAYVEGNILHKDTVVKLDFLENICVQQLAKTLFANTEYRSKKLKAKLAVYYEEKLSFQPIQSQSGRFGTYLVFNTDIKVR